MSGPMRDWTYVVYNCLVFIGFLMFSFSVYHSEKNYKANSENIAANREALEATAIRVAAELEMQRNDMGHVAHTLTKDQIDLRRSMTELAIGHAKLAKEINGKQDEVIRILRKLEQR